MNELANLDIALIGFYFLVLVGMAIYFSGEEKDPRGYFLADRNIGWVAIGTSLFVSNIASEHLIAVWGMAAWDDIIVGNFEWVSCLAILALGWFLVPIFIKSEIFTIPEFFEKRYNASIRMYMTILSITGYMLTKITITLFAGSLLLYEILGWDISSAAMAMVTVAGFYAIVGGLRAIVHIDVFQTIILACGAVALTVFGLRELGGISGLHVAVPEDLFTVFRPVSEPDFPLSGIVLGAPIIGIWYWCTDQAVAQRVLGARNINHARTGIVLAGFLKLLPVLFFILPSLILAVLYKGNTQVGNFSIASFLSGSFLPAGLQGIVILGLLAPMISCLASCFNSSSSLITMDLYRHFNPNAPAQKLVLVGRLATVGLVLFTILWMPLLKHLSSHVYIYLQQVLAYFGPPVVCIFVLGLIGSKLNDKGAFWTLVVGNVVGGARFVLEIFESQGFTIGEPLRPFVEMNFLHFAAFLFFTCSIIFIGFSFASANYNKVRSAKLFFNRAGFLKEIINSRWQRVNLMLSIVMVILIVSLFQLF